MALAFRSCLCGSKNNGSRLDSKRSFNNIIFVHFCACRGGEISLRCPTADSGGDGRGGSPPGGREAGNPPGGGGGAQPQLPGLRRRAATVPEQDEERQDAPRRAQPAGGQGLRGGPVQGHGGLDATTAAL